MSKDMGNALLALAERCEAATGLRDDIATLQLKHEIATAMHEQGWHPTACLRQFVSSIDAALTLVDDQLVTVVMREALDRLDQCFDPMENYLAKLRLFVCAAALRARASVEGGVK